MKWPLFTCLSTAFQMSDDEFVIKKIKMLLFSFLDSTFEISHYPCLLNILCTDPITKQIRNESSLVIGFGACKSWEKYIYIHFQYFYTCVWYNRNSFGLYFISLGNIFRHELRCIENKQNNVILMHHEFTLEIMRSYFCYNSTIELIIQYLF